jgi:hypothetical protein
MKELAALQLASDLLIGIAEAAATVQKINALITKVQAGGGKVTDADWEDLDKSSYAAKAALAEARKNAGFA